MDMQQSASTATPSSDAKPRRSLFWQVTTVLVTQAVGSAPFLLLAGLAVSYAEAPLSGLAPLLLVLKLVLYLLALVPGLFLGIRYVIAKSAVDDDRAEKIVVFLTAIGLFWPLPRLVAAFLSHGDVLSIAMKVIAVPVVTYLLSRRFLSKQARAAERVLGMDVRRAERYSWLLYIVLFYLLLGMILWASFGNNPKVLEALPFGMQQQISQLKNKQAAEIRASRDETILQFGPQLPGVIDFVALRGPLPATLKEVLMEAWNDPNAAGLADNFEYSVGDDGRTYTLCGVLSTGEKKCWNNEPAASDNGQQVPEGQSPAPVLPSN